MDRFAKIIRTLTVPPIMTLALLLTTFFSGRVFADKPVFLLSILFLVLIPTIAYPLSGIIPKLKAKGRAGQRTLAFEFSLLGYSAALVYGLVAHVGRGVLLIYLAYFISVVMLVIFNMIVKKRASGHACSITGPLLLMVYFMGRKIILPCILLLALASWSSLRLKRHTRSDLLFGMLSAGIAFGVSLLIVAL